eukprot:1159549-Pelagomonas_calceolata.AAC.3
MVRVWGAWMQLPLASSTTTGRTSALATALMSCSRPSREGGLWDLAALKQTARWSFFSQVPKARNFLGRHPVLDLQQLNRYTMSPVLAGRTSSCVQCWRAHSGIVIKRTATRERGGMRPWVHKRMHRRKGERMRKWMHQGKGEKMH